MIVALGIFAYVLILVMISLFRSGKRGWGWICAGLLIVGFLALSWLIVRLVRTTLTVLAIYAEAVGDGGSGGGFGGGGFSGGFSGGGGATGSW